MATHTVRAWATEREPEEPVAERKEEMALRSMDCSEAWESFIATNSEKLVIKATVA